MVPNLCPEKRDREKGKTVSFLEVKINMYTPVWVKQTKKKGGAYLFYTPRPEAVFSLSLADAYSTLAYSLGLHFLGNLMQLSVL